MGHSDCSSRVHIVLLVHDMLHKLEVALDRSAFHLLVYHPARCPAGLSGLHPQLTEVFEEDRELVGVHLVHVGMDEVLLSGKDSVQAEEDPKTLRHGAVEDMRLQMRYQIAIADQSPCFDLVAVCWSIGVDDRRDADVLGLSWIIPGTTRDTVFVLSSEANGTRYGTLRNCTRPHGRPSRMEEL